MGEHDYAEEILKPVAKATTEAEEAEAEPAGEKAKNGGGGGGDGEPPEKRQKPSPDAAVEAKKPQMETVVVKKHASFVPLAKAFKEFDWKAKENERQLKRLSETYPILRWVV